MNETLSLALNMMWQGMAGLFIVMIVIAFIVVFLSKLTK